MTDTRPFNPPRLARDTLARVRFNRRYLPLSSADRDWLAKALSMYACELLKGEHRASSGLVIFRNEDAEP